MQYICILSIRNVNVTEQLSYTRHMFLSTVCCRAEQMELNVAWQAVEGQLCSIIFTTAQPLQAPLKHIPLRAARQSRHVTFRKKGST